MNTLMTKLFLSLSLCALCAFPLSGITAAPNIVIIMTDDQDDMGSMSVMPKTRTLIGNEGLTFTNSFVDFSLCCPSRASFLTGQAGHNNGIEDNAPPDGGYHKFQPNEGNTLPVWLQQAGYFTVHMGKYLNGYGNTASNNTHVPPGWDLWHGMPDWYGAYAYNNYLINKNGVLQAYGNAVTDYKTDVQAQNAADFIASQQGSAQPFFLWLTPLAPHTGPADANGDLFAYPAPRHNGLLDTETLPTSPNLNEADTSDKPGFIKNVLPLFE